MFNSTEKNLGLPRTWLYQRVAFRQSEKFGPARFRRDMGVQCMDKEKEEKQLSDMELMKERLAKLLLGEDMSGGSQGVSSALALSNAITNLSASIFGELRRLEPLAPERKTKWCQEIEWLLSVTHHIVEFVPSYQSSLDGTLVEIMVTKPRLDLQMNIPALRKLDAMLLEFLDKFKETEFGYVDRSMTESDKDEYNQQRQVHKWWLPIPKVLQGGLSDGARKMLQHQRESVNQVLKAAMAINAQVLAEMEIPDVYWNSLPKNGRASLGDAIYHHITSEQFSPESLLSSLDLSSEHSILDVKNRIEASIAIWKQKILNKVNKNASKSYWGTTNVERRELLGERAETILLLLKQRYPGLPQTVLDMSKIQYNKDVGQSILESYSRVLESLAFNILSRIDDVFHADKLAKYPPPSDQSFCSSPSTDSMIKSISEDPSPYCTHSSTSCIHPTQWNSPIKLQNIQVAPETVSDISPTDSPHSMTLSDYMGWHIIRPPDNDCVSKPHDQDLSEPCKVLNQQHHVKSLKKLPVMITSKQRMLYIERLENEGVFHSPAARD